MPGTLSPNQQAMLDLALACDLKVCDPAQYDTIRARHKAIKNQSDAADYIREVENKIHSRRKFRSPTKAIAVARPVVKPLTKLKPLTCLQTFLAILFLLILTGVAGWFAQAGINFILVALSMLLMMMVLGISTANRPLGILINERNLMSLSRFQMALWTLLVLSAYLTFAFARIKMMFQNLPNGHPITDPLGVGIDPQLWALLGISTTSLVGSSLILSSKKDQEPAPSVTQKTAQMTNESVADVSSNREGILYANSKISDACVTDMFEGDELINTARIDLAKVQMFYFTIIAALCFVVMTFKVLVNDKSDLGQLPALPTGFVALLGISHAGYLTSKSVNRTQSES